MKAVHVYHHYLAPVHFQEACAHWGYRRGAFHTTELVTEWILSLPTYAEKTLLQREYAVSALCQAVTQSLGIR